jgi:CLIP-associating protein 1/2
MLIQVSNEAHQCLYVLVAKYDPFRCLAVWPEHLLMKRKFLHYYLLQPATYTFLDFFACVQIIAPFLASDDEKTLVMCINCLTKVSKFCTVIMNDKI